MGETFFWICALFFGFQITKQKFAVRPLESLRSQLVAYPNEKICILHIFHKFLLVLISSQLYGQLSRHPMAHFSSYDNVYTVSASSDAITNENHRKPQIFGPAQNPSAH